MRHGQVLSSFHATHPLRLFFLELFRGDLPDPPSKSNISTVNFIPDRAASSLFLTGRRGDICTAVDMEKKEGKAHCSVRKKEKERSSIFIDGEMSVKLGAVDNANNKFGGRG